MPQEPIYDSITFNELGEQLSETVKVENKTDVISEDVKKVLCVSAVSSVSTSDVIDGKISFGGKIAFSIIYELNDGELKKTECGSEFLGTIVDEKINAKTEIEISSEVVKTDYSLSGTRLTVSAITLVTANPLYIKEINALVGGDGLVFKNGEITAQRGFGIKLDTYPIEEEFTLNYQVQEVLSHTAKPVITAVQCGVGCIIIDGEVFLSALLLQNGEKSDIIRENKLMPFRVELEYEEAMPTISATATVDVKSFKTDITVDEENNKSQVLASVVLQFTSSAYTEQAYPLIFDVFSTAVNLDVKREDCNIRYNKALRSCENRLTVKTNIQELPAGVRLMSVGNENFEVVSTSLVDDKITLNGILTVTAFTRDSEGVNDSFKVETPVDAVIDCNIDGYSYTLKCVSVNASARLISLDTIEIETDVMFTVYVQAKCNFSYISEIKECGEKVNPTSAISVYIALEGEDIWSLAKRLNVCPEDLKATNKELTFPLTSNERIVIYRQK